MGIEVRYTLKYLSFLFLMFLSYPLHGQDFGVYNVGDLGLSFFEDIKTNELGSEVVLYCDDPHDELPQSMELILPLRNSDLNNFSFPRAREDKSYSGYDRFYTSRFQLYLSISGVDDLKKHPIDHPYISSLDKMVYSVESEGEEDGPDDYLWGAYFHFSNKIPGQVIKYIIENEDVYINLNSWNRIIKSIKIPNEGKALAFKRYLTSCFQEK
ncbi:hypothetical protein [Rhizobium sp. RU36D]|uniref:hypothetical protein n=1 Tax=Rhizobium sp. RU36D TaxID=1907415 RepID=UPI000A0191B5|nr:hypothetical protein [Rhizobium sp. RU36D]